MRAIAVVAVVLMSLVAQTVAAADLEAGSYAKVASLLVYYEGTFNEYPAGPSSQAGTYGPFEVGASTWWAWIVDVAESAHNVAPNTAVYAYENPAANYNVTRVTFEYQTDYDANQMRLELVTMDRQTTPTNVNVIWSQSLSGYQSGLYDSYWGNYARTQDQMFGLRVITVPEPPTLLGLLLPSLALFGIKRRIGR